MRNGGRSARLKKFEGYQRKFWAYELDPKNPEMRIDFAYHRMKDLISKAKETVRLGEVVENVVRLPDEQEIYRFATVSRVDGRVRFKEETTTSYESKDLRVVKSGDLLVSGIDFVNGSVGTVHKNCNDLVVSKEYFTLRPKKGVRYRALPEYLAAVLRSRQMREIIEGTVTGTSNRTRVQNVEVLLDLPIPKPTSLDNQKKVERKVKAAFKAQDRAERDLLNIGTSILGP
ncbi:hypothetical protein HZA56_01140 [Candidatus Poribacteria bacterium]|nr:hypothetical protein [Candidatus Poribacteria bacterium]